MKSSTNPQPGSFYTWDPKNLESNEAQQQVPEGYIQRLLEIFQSPDEILKGGEDQTGKGTKEKYFQSVSNWSPPEIEDLEATGFEDGKYGEGPDLEALLNRQQFEGAQAVVVGAWSPLDFSDLSKEELDAFQESELEPEDLQPDQEVLAKYVSPDPNEIIQKALSEADALVKEKLTEADRQVDQIIQEAKAEVEAAREQASVELEVTWQQARKEIEETRERALQEGKADGVTAGYAEMESVIQTSRNILEQFYAWRNEMLAQSEETVLGMIKEIARVLFMDGFELDKNSLQQTFSKVLANARSLGDLRVYVNPEDARQLDPAWREYQSLVAAQNIKVFPTEGIRRGGCYVEGQQGTIDARVETQLTALLESLARAGETSGSPEDEANE